MCLTEPRAVDIIQTATGKIKELRNLVENLSKKICVSDNTDQMHISKLKQNIDKLKMDKRKLIVENNKLQNIQGDAYKVSICHLAENSYLFRR